MIGSDQAAGPGAQPQVEQRRRSDSKQQPGTGTVQRDEGCRQQKPARADARTPQLPARRDRLVRQRQQHAAHHEFLDDRGNDRSNGGCHRDDDRVESAARQHQQVEC